MSKNYFTHYEGISQEGYFTGEGDPQHEIALTFDDGPSEATVLLADLLNRLGVRASFFVIGKHVQEGNGPRILNLLLKLGHTVGWHTQKHPFLPSMGDKRIVKEVAPPFSCKYFRPPFGCVDDRVKAEIKANNLTPILWNVSSYDWKLDEPTKIHDRVAENLRPGRNVVLLHDGDAKGKRDCTTTVGAVEKIIATGLAQGYKFVTITDICPA